MAYFCKYLKGHGILGSILQCFQIFGDICHVYLMIGDIFQINLRDLGYWDPLTGPQGCENPIHDLSNTGNLPSGLSNFPAELPADK